MRMLGALVVTMAFAVVVYVITGSMALAGVTGAIGGISYLRSLR